MNSKEQENLPDTETSASGGCLCGSLRYHARPIADTAYYCHCRDCQIGSSSAFTVAVFSKEGDFKVTQGTLSSYSKLADSGRSVHRHFCANCGTPVSWSGAGFPGVVLLSLSSLDQPEDYTPVHEGWTKRAVSWCRIPTDIQSFPGRPDRN